MSTKPVKISPLKRHGFPKRWVFVDCETRMDPDYSTSVNEVQVLWFGVAKYCVWKRRGLQEESRALFESTSAFWNWFERLCDTKEPIMLVAHNAAFDATILGLWELIKEGKITVAGGASEDDDDDDKGKKVKREESPIIVIDSPPTIISLKFTNGKLFQLVDSLNYCPVPLHVLGESVGIPKLEMPSREAPFDEWVNYCERDVDVLAAFFCRLLRWWNQGKYGKWAYTAPGLAIAAWRTHFLKGDVWPARDWIYKLERAAYYGGRVQPFWLGQSDGRYYQFDIQSCYGSVMLDGQYPVRVVTACNGGDKVVTPPPTETLLPVIGDVEVEIEQPVVPVRTDKGNIYPIGRFRAILCGPELELVQRHGRLVTWHSWVLYELRPLFEDYVRHFWEQRLDAKRKNDTATELFCKLMLNSLYGKFGQHGLRWQLVQGYVPLTKLGIWYESIVGQTTERKLLAFGDKTFAEIEVDPPNHVCPAIAAYVTSYARDLLWRYIEAAGLDHVYYVATDSLIVDEEGRANLEASGCVENGRLGALKLVTEGDGLWINSIHWYGIGEKKVVGGVSSRAQEVGPGRWRELHFETLRQIIDRGGAARVSISQREKSKKVGYYGGSCDESGRVIPFTLPDEAGSLPLTIRTGWA
jgi:hypothetical protein